MDKPGIVYILTNWHRKVLYTGVTSSIAKRMYEHRNGLTKGFTTKYKTKTLVYYEVWEDIEYAILREKQIKAGARADKIRLIEKQNPQWEDLYPKVRTWI